nr:hypothetical protein PJ912_01055 [Pectobacterium colocasium]
MDADILAAQTRYQKFAIVSTPRAGTHLLRTLLGSHPNIEMHGEAFNRFGQHLLPYSVKDTTMETILHRHLFRPYFEYVEAVGFVLFRDLDSQWGDASIWPALQAIPDSETDPVGKKKPATAICVVEEKPARSHLVRRQAG